MRLTTLVAGTVAGVAGLAGATAGYTQLSASPRHSEPVVVADTAATSPATTAPPAPVTRVRLRDCPRGFALRGKACVREVERTVVINVAPPAAAPARAVAPAEVPPAPVEPSDDPVTHDQGDDHGGAPQAHHPEHATSDDDQGEDHGGREHADEDHGDDEDHAEAEDHGDDEDHAEVEDHADEPGDD